MIQEKKSKTVTVTGECSEFIYETHICIRVRRACCLKSTILTKGVSDNSN
jgi:hypothetical protein